MGLNLFSFQITKHLPIFVIQTDRLSLKHNVPHPANVKLVSCDFFVIFYRKTPKTWPKDKCPALQSICFTLSSKHFAL